MKIKRKLKINPRSIQTLNFQAMLWSQCMVMSLKCKQTKVKRGQDFVTCDSINPKERWRSCLRYAVTQFLLRCDVIIVTLNLSDHCALCRIFCDIHEVYWLLHLWDIVVDVRDFDVDLVACVEGDKASVCGIYCEPIVGGALTVQHPTGSNDAYNIDITQSRKIVE